MSKKLLTVLAAALCAMLALLGACSGRLRITGVSDGGVYVLGTDVVAPEFDRGEGALQKDGGPARPFESGTPITEAGDYVLTVTWEEEEVSVSFTVENPAAEPPVVSGVADGDKVVYGTAITPTFDKGTATLQKDGGEKADFVSGTAVTEIGSYVLTVTDGEASVSVSFEITLPDYTGQITDEFLCNTMAGSYISSDASFTAENESLTIRDNADNQAWGIVKRKIEHVNLNEYPYLELALTSMTNCTAAIKVGQEEFALDADMLVSKFSVPGRYVVDLKPWAESRGMTLDDCEVWLQLIVEGQSANDGQMSAVFDYYRSVKEIPGLEPAGPYVDNTPETINQWQADTANIRWFEGDDFASAVVTDGSADYGKFVKRVNFNTALYPFLIVDIAEVVIDWKIEGFVVENWQMTSTPLPIISGTEAGVYEVNLQNLFGAKENVDIVLEFYINGKSDTEMFRLNGLWTTDEAYYPPRVTGAAEGAVLNLYTGDIVIGFDKGTATLQKDDGQPAAFENGGKITEVGSYRLTVTYGDKTTTINFTVVNENTDPDLVDNFRNISAFAKESGEGTMELTTEGQIALKNGVGQDVKIGSAAAYTFDFTDKNVLVLEFIANAGFDGNLNIEILDDVNWVQAAAKASALAKETYDAGDGKTGYRVYFVIDKAVKTDGSGTEVVWKGEKVSAKLKLHLENESAEITLLSLRCATEADVPEIEVSALIEDFNDLSAFVKESGEGTYELNADGQITLKNGAGQDVKIGSTVSYNFDFIEKNVLALEFIANESFDGNLNIELLDDVNWVEVKAKASALAKETYNAGEGRVGYFVYLVVDKAVKTDGSGTEVAWKGEKVSAKLKLHLENESAEVVLLSLRCATEADLPKPADPDLIENFKGLNFTTDAETSGEVTRDGNGRLTLKTAPDQIANVKSSAYSFDFTEKNVLVLEFIANEAFGDNGLELELLDDVNWVNLKVTLNSLPKTTFDAGEGKVGYRYYLVINEGTKTDGSGTKVTWKGEKISAKLGLRLFSWNAEVTFVSLSYASESEIPA